MLRKHDPAFKSVVDDSIKRQIADGCWAVGPTAVHAAHPASQRENRSAHVRTLHTAPERQHLLEDYNKNKLNGFLTHAPSDGPFEGVFAAGHPVPRCVGSERERVCELGLQVFAKTHRAGSRAGPFSIKGVLTSPISTGCCRFGADGRSLLACCWRWCWAS
jgi:hypothetical protein